MISETPKKERVGDLIPSVTTIHPETILTLEHPPYIECKAYMKDQGKREKKKKERKQIKLIFIYMFTVFPSPQNIMGEFKAISRKLKDSTKV